MTRSKSKMHNYRKIVYSHTYPRNHEPLAYLVSKGFVHFWTFAHTIAYLDMGKDFWTFARGDAYLLICRHLWTFAHGDAYLSIGGKTRITRWLENRAYKETRTNEVDTHLYVSLP